MPKPFNFLGWHFLLKRQDLTSLSDFSCWNAKILLLWVLFKEKPNLISVTALQGKKKSQVYNIEMRTLMRKWYLSRNKHEIWNDVNQWKISIGLFINFFYLKLWQISFFFFSFFFLFFFFKFIWWQIFFLVVVSKNIHDGILVSDFLFFFFGVLLLIFEQKKKKA